MRQRSQCYHSCTCLPGIGSVPPGEAPDALETFERVVETGIQLAERKRGYLATVEADIDVGRRQPDHGGFENALKRVKRRSKSSCILVASTNSHSLQGRSSQTTH